MKLHFALLSLLSLSSFAAGVESRHRHLEGGSDYGDYGDGDDDDGYDSTHYASGKKDGKKGGKKGEGDYDGGKKGEGDYDGGKKSEGDYNDDDEKEPTSIIATIDTKLIKATVKAIDYKPGQAKWIVDIDYVNKDKLCPEGEVNWHIHGLALVDKKGNGFSNMPEDSATSKCLSVGGHWDPSLACGPNSQFIGTTCTGFQSVYISTGAYSTRCTTTTPAGSGCEYGDIGGKVGKIQLRKGTQYFKDPFIQTPVADFYEHLSVVFHCDGAPRVACANFHSAN
jgi:hypothetical protein